MGKVLNLFPARVPIGTVQSDGTVLMSGEFARALDALLERVGGPSSISMQDIVNLASSEAENAQALVLRAEMDALRVSGEPPAALSALAAEVAELRATIGQVGPALALYQQIEAMRVELAMIEDPAAQVRHILTRYAPLLSPNFQGTPTAPTAAVDTNTTQLATCAFVLNQGSTTAPLMNGAIAAPGGSTRYARADHVHPSDSSKQGAIAAATVTGSRGGNAALTSLLSGLAGQGLIINSTTA